MNHPGEVTRIRKLTSVTLRRGNSISISPFAGRRGTVGWSACRVGSAMPPATHCQGYCSLVGPTRLLYYAVNRLLSGALFVGQPDTSALPCYQLLIVRGFAG
ncbi:hypothetical protein BHE74_00027544 [Ensete ventricosum]|nr:hypothetical protein BHE74_00027544 [Ensete ventricosum]